MDGVIYHGNKLLPGVREFVKWLTDNKKHYLFLTNSGQYTPKELQQKLARMGLDAALVLSGVTSREGCEQYPYRPRLILNSVGDIPE